MNKEEQAKLRDLATRAIRGPYFTPKDRIEPAFAELSSAHRFGFARVVDIVDEDETTSSSRCAMATRQMFEMLDPASIISLLDAVQTTDASLRARIVQLEELIETGRISARCREAKLMARLSEIVDMIQSV